MRGLDQVGEAQPRREHAGRGVYLSSGGNGGGEYLAGAVAQAVLRKRGLKIGDGGGDRYRSPLHSEGRDRGRRVRSPPWFSSGTG